MEELRDRLAGMLVNKFGPNFHPELLDEFERIARDAVTPMIEAAQRDRDAARELAAHSRNQLAEVIDQRDGARADLALAKAWIAQHANRDVFEAWLGQARAARS